MQVAARGRRLAERANELVVDVVDLDRGQAEPFEPGRGAGFPAEDERAFGNTLRVVAGAGLTKVHVFPYSPRPGTGTAAEDPVPPQVKKERSARLRAASHAACLAHWSSKIGRDDVVLVDRPGRGYGDDYSPWLVPESAPVGELIRVRGAAVAEEGILAA